MLATPSKFRYGDTDKRLSLQEGTSTKLILRSILEDAVGPAISNRGKYGFAANFAMSDRFSKQLEMDDVQNEIALINHQMTPYQIRLPEKHLSPDLRWFLHSVCQTTRKLDEFNREFKEL
jgi:hypothetical protein